MSALARAWSAAWFGPVLDVRVWLMGKAILVMLALDAWVLMIERGGRYGAGAFNVAHFAWLDAVQPLPTAGLYVGLVLTVGVLALMTALGALGRLGIIALTVLYTYSWAMSQLDSYQHHVFISWVLLCLCCFPTLRAGEVFAERRVICAWGYRLLAAITAVLYLFTGVSKTEPQWLSGGVLKRINVAKKGDDGALEQGVLEPLRTFFVDMGVDEATFWALGGASVVIVQWLITAVWLSALCGEGRGAWWLRVGRLVGVLAAVAFHLGAEVMGLRIGWFSWYMLALTLIAFTPTAILRALAAELGGELLSRWRRRSQGAAPPALWGVIIAAAAACFVVTGRDLDLPGTASAGLIWGALVGLAAIHAVVRKEHLRGVAIAAAITGATMSVSLEHSRVRFDFYRYVGGDATRRLELQNAMDAYGYANTFAPEGEDRRKKVAKVKALLRKNRGAK